MSRNGITNRGAHRGGPAGCRVAALLAAGIALAAGLAAAQTAEQADSPSDAPAARAEAPARAESRSPPASDYVYVRLPRRGRPGALVPGLIRPYRIWDSLPADAYVYDHRQQLFYSPNVSLVQVTLKVGPEQTPVATYYENPAVMLPRNSALYRAMLARAARGSAAAARRDKGAPPPAPAPADPMESARMIAARFRSRLAPMLGGPERVPLRFAVGEAHLREGRFAQAVSSFDRSTRGDEDPVPLLALAATFLAEGQYEAAADMLRRGMDALRDPDLLDVDWAEVLGGAEAAQTLERALRERLSRPSEGPDARLLLGFYYFASRRDEAAASVLSEGDVAAEPLLGELRAAAEQRLQAAQAAQAAREAARAPAAPAAAAAAKR